MAKVSVIVPSRNERFLGPTVKDLLSKARGDVELLVVLDGYWPDEPLPDLPNVIAIHRGQAQGLRAAINTAAALASGEFLLKCDAHCMFAEGYDVTLAEECALDWIVIPARYSLEPETWTIAETGKSRVDYHYLSYPYPVHAGSGLHGVEWHERARARRGLLLDDEMSFQGSCWFMSKQHFAWLGGLKEELYGTFMGEPQEIGLKTWLGGGAVKVNKRTWYAHLHKGKTYGRGYSFPHGERDTYSRAGAEYWMRNRWEGQVHPLSWLIEKFWPVPTWPADALERWEQHVEAQV